MFQSLWAARMEPRPGGGHRLHAEQVGSYLWAKEAAQSAGLHWSDSALMKPRLPANQRTVRILGKPYHYQQDYTGTLKLFPGESPW